MSRHTLVASAVPTSDSGSGSHYLDISRITYKRADAVPLRIMPVGASVTFGVGSTTGDSYRKDLQDLLKAQGMTAEYVGSKKNGKDFTNNKVEATSGFVIAQIAKSVKTAAPKFKPNLVLLDAGTNNCNKGGEVPDAGKSVAAMVDGIYTDSPGATVVLATVLANKDAAQDKCRVGINAQYQTLATDMAAKKAKFVLVDMRSPEGPTVNDLNDSRHPNDAGYAKMAAVWLKGIQEAQTKGFLTAPAAVAETAGGSGSTGKSDKHNKGSKHGGGAAKNSTMPATGDKPKGGKKGAHMGGAKNATQPATGDKPREGKNPSKGGQKGKQPAKNATQPATPNKPSGGQKGGAAGGQKQNSTKGGATPVKAGSSVAYEFHTFVTVGVMGTALFFLL
ncbi:carbohydrate esterase family 3 protein [Apiospora saccharicola]|uniref:Carbohydrate esterase family 3 protein n=1 Tax=Apiospora saccharicola TaxID=335842 RepID=A0ABR1UMY3_9PEZI